jgi:hypothetical protein
MQRFLHISKNILLLVCDMHHRGKKRVFQIMECLLRQSFHVSRHLLNNKEKNTLGKMCFDCIEKIIASIYLARKPLGERHYKNKRLMQGGV